MKQDGKQIFNAKQNMKMRKSLMIAVLLLCSVTLVFGQRGRGMQRIHAAKMTYLTDRMVLTEAQASKFIPLYRSYEKQLLVIRQPYMKKYNVTGGADERTAARIYVEDDLDYQQQVLELKKAYRERFLKVISPEQLSEMYVAEREFRQLLIKRLKQKKARAGRQ
jgi:hypothetical protein